MLKFKLVTLEGVKHEGEVHEALVPTPQGQIAVFEHHAPLVSLVDRGVIKVRVKSNDPDDFMEAYATQGGVVEISDNEVKVLVDEADAAEELNKQEVQRAHDRAQQLLKEAKDQISLDHARTLINRTSVQLKVADMKRRHKNKTGSLRQ